MEKALKVTPWYVAYNKIALQLHRFYKKPQFDAGQALFKLLNNSPVYRKHNSWLAKVRGMKYRSVEPIQFFLGFSRSGQNESVRTEIINESLKLLGSSQKGWEKIDFSGCPTPFGLKMLSIRQENVQKRIWETFDVLMRNGKKALTSLLWDEAKTWRGIQIPSFTIFLFWIKSKEFLALDKNTRQYLELNNLLKPLINLTVEDYLALLNDKRIANYSNFSLEAYYFINDPAIFKERFGSGVLAPNLNRTDTTFRLIGLRLLKKNAIVHKILKPNKYYPIDNAISPQERNTKDAVLQKFYPRVIEAESIYNLKDLKVNITAIVGKNGSGKSTLIDLMMMGIYNLSIELGYLDRKENQPLKSLNFEIYWHTDTLYKLSFGQEIIYYSFEQITKEDKAIEYQLNKKSIKLKELKVNFFYSILVNYSHYALNSTDYTIDWITALTHKNDGYMTPLVINPKRTNGDIEINNEKDLLNMRLILNLLELHDADIPKQSFRYIDNGKYLKYFSIFYDEAKQNNKIKEAKERVYDDTKVVQLVFERITEVFDLSNENYNDIVYLESIKHYLFNKMLTIVDTYDKYRSEYKDGLDFFIMQNIATTVELSSWELESLLVDRVSELLRDIKKDPSHISLKFKQVINYLKYPSLQKVLNNAIETKDLVDLDKYQKILDTIISSAIDENLTIAELLPPTLFKLDFHLNDPDKSSFSKASSGEYQLISVLSSVLYHIRNIDSVEEGSKYNYLTVLLDEIELYFHPNMQRLFIRKLLEALSKLENELYGIHILFATHSPFILSDIQQQKILKLKNGEIVNSGNGYNTFAANIHDLLADEFFLDEGYMGAFAQKQIETAINLLNYIKADTNIKKDIANGRALSVKERTFLQHKFKTEKDLYEERLRILNYWHDGRNPETLDTETVKRQLFQLIDIIGEPLIKEKMKNMYDSTFSETADI